VSPTWSNAIQAQINLMEVSQDPSTNPSTGKKRATILVRPRGWHLQEAHFVVDGAPMSASLFDFGLHFFHNARALLQNGSGPYFYLPKMESHLEVRAQTPVLFSLLGQELTRQTSYLTFVRLACGMMCSILLKIGSVSLGAPSRPRSSLRPSLLLLRWMRFFMSSEIILLDSIAADGIVRSKYFSVGVLF
jgi:hypothetical protein